MGSWFRVVRTVVGHGSLWYRQSMEYEKTMFGGACPGFSRCDTPYIKHILLLLTIDISTFWLVYGVSLFDSTKILVILNVST